MNNVLRVSRQGGFSLLEVLIAMVVLSVGLLALTALQINSLRATNEAQQITNVSLLAKEMADRMRANPSQLLSYSGTSLTAADDSAPDCAAENASCSAEELQAFDVNQWITTLVKVLNIVRGSIFRIDGSPDEYVIGIQWDHDRDGALAPAADCNSEHDVDKPVVSEGCYKLRFAP